MTFTAGLMPLSRRHLFAGFSAPFLAAWERVAAMPLPQILRLAGAAPPRCIQGFKTTFSAQTKPVPTAVFNVTCANCPGEAFTVLERKVDWGKEMTCTGLWLECTTCKARSELFDMRRDGYDGGFGHLDFIRGSETEQPLMDKAGRAFGGVQIRVAFTYNIEFGELQGDATETRSRPQDLFDWFTLDVKPDSRWREDAWDCECA